MLYHYQLLGGGHYCVLAHLLHWVASFPHYMINSLINSYQFSVLSLNRNIAHVWMWSSCSVACEGEGETVPKVSSEWYFHNHTHPYFDCYVLSLLWGWDLSGGSRLGLAILGNILIPPPPYFDTPPLPISSDAMAYGIGVTRPLPSAVRLWGCEVISITVHTCYIGLPHFPLYDCPEFE